ncbi:MAG: zinc-dependent alcohol dehydrogenase [Acidimicrobiales bacterium]
MAMTETMKAVVKRAPGRGQVAVQDVPVPHAGPGQVRLAVIATGICGTDLHIADDEFPSRPPVVMGHEVSGIVDETGPGVPGHLMGQRAALETYASTCGSCQWCRSGRRNLCSERRSIGSAVDGGFASYVVVPAQNVHLVHGSVSRLGGALYEPLACVAHALCDPAVASPGDPALVVGPGAIGLLAAQVLRAQGASVTVVGAERDTARLAVAASLGFVALRSEEVGPSTTGSEFSVVAECSGAEQGVAVALESAAKGARIVQIGLAGRPVAIQLDQICLKELRVTSGNASTPGSWRRAELMVACGSVSFDGLVSAPLPIPSWPEAFARARAGEGVKLVLEPSAT